MEPKEAYLKLSSPRKSYDISTSKPGKIGKSSHAINNIGKHSRAVFRLQSVNLKPGPRSNA